ncbi:MAG: hypothetical protein G01um101419_847 [Parcubacteria group bacterium Gr01-1014_19]|nr:MAG: hypothetical protein G01um101419_847 [Parcubacteria group bacterium Gr01-1014_19]
MLAKKYKLPLQLFPGKRGKLLKSPYFTLKTFQSDLGFSRFGVTISAKTAPKAVKRNEMKRMAFSFFKSRIVSLPLADYWLTVLSPATSLPKGEFVRELEKITHG